MRRLQWTQSPSAGEERGDRVGGRRPAVHAELVEDRSQMRADTFTQHKPLGDLGVARPISDQLQNFDFPGSQARGPARSSSSADTASSQAAWPVRVQLSPGLIRLEPGSLAEAAADASGDSWKSLGIGTTGRADGLPPAGRSPEQPRGQIEVTGAAAMGARPSGAGTFGRRTDSPADNAERPGRHSAQREFALVARRQAQINLRMARPQGAVQALELVALS